MVASIFSFAYWSFAYLFWRNVYFYASSTLLCYCFVVIFKISKCKSANSLLLKIVLSILDPPNFHMNFRISLLVSEKKPTLNL